MLLTLAFNIFSYYFNRCTARCKQAEALTPEILLPKLLAYLRKLFFQKSAACTFVSVYEFADFGFRMRLEKYMNMVFIVIPFLQSNIVIGSDVLKYLLISVFGCALKSI